MRIRLALVLSIWQSILIPSYAARAFAHGEAADEPFLKDLTVAFYDVHMTPTEVKVGDPVTITGTCQNSRNLAVYARSAADRIHYSSGAGAVSSP